MYNFNIMSKEQLKNKIAQASNNTQSTQSSAYGQTMKLNDLN